MPLANHVDLSKCQCVRCTYPDYYFSDDDKTTDYIGSMDSLEMGSTHFRV